MTVVGLYGKLASRGDFVSRGLPQSFIGPWDSWLAAGLLASQNALGEQWLNAYLVSPLWRFALAPGVCGPQAAVGVVMPSIDRVGRYFPLTVAALLAPEADLASLISGPQQWFEQVEELLLATLEEGARFEALEEGLQALGTPSPASRIEGSHYAGLQRFYVSDPQARGVVLAAQACAGSSAWWGRGSQDISPMLLRCQGLPPTNEFAQFLLGQEGAV
ncbi:type VI secretion system-associated protein TagF [Pseudomonas protegens]|uniref:type VI secretion system-associated protein TagF n=1 Tax=Pseudomonas protegens TaxID=380021 RepID=UPI0027769453|nr:type VI secretion system-associated protein TagF [Pseudomonas protegens]MDP9527875.1 type VI secretion system-associated protein TagF [Pseudomonas protegens]